MTYFLYVIIVVLLLLNLIIAIMSTTAGEIMINPWKDVLWTVEWLDETTSVEYTFSVLGLPFRNCCTCSFLSHRNAGFIVKKVEGQYRIYIKLFHCPALKYHRNATDIISIMIVLLHIFLNKNTLKHITMCG